MALLFGRRERMGKWLRERPRSFWDWEKREGVLTPQWYDQYTAEEGTPMLLDQATPRNVTRALEEINAFEWEGDFKPLARQALKELLEKRLEEEMAEHLGLSRYEHAAIGTIIETAIMSDTCSARWGIWSFWCRAAGGGSFPPGSLNAMRDAAVQWTRFCWLVFVWGFRRERPPRC